MLILILLFLATLFLAYSNGSNDNFKGVATLFGSGTTDYRHAIWLATGATLLGSVSSVFLAGTLLKNFSGKGMVPDALVGSPHFLLAIAVGAGLTVLLATLTGFPISTTHSLVGALAGTGLVAAGSQVRLMVLGANFFWPLLASPFVALLLGGGAYFVFRRARLGLGIEESTCLCAGEVHTAPCALASQAEVVMEAQQTVPVLWVRSEEECREALPVRRWGLNSLKALDTAHYLSAGVVSFARGLNDTPKIVALLLSVSFIDLRYSMLAVALGMALGGLLNAKKVALTMSKKITPLNHGQGFAANLVTGLLVIFASRWGVPVSTTHVSVGSLFGIGMVTGEADRKVVRSILYSWLLTLPVAALLSAGFYLLVTAL